jgi:hypothetical protein
MDRHLLHTVPALPASLEYQRLDAYELEIRSVSSLLSARAHYLEPTTLQSAVDDAGDIADRRHAVPLRGLPLQLR